MKPGKFKVIPTASVAWGASLQGASHQASLFAFLFQDLLSLLLMVHGTKQGSISTLEFTQFSQTRMYCRTSYPLSHVSGRENV